MTNPSQRLSAALTALRWGVTAFAGAANISDRTVHRWLAGQNEPPEALVAWVEDIGRYLRDNPPPDPRHKQNQRDNEK